MTPGQLTIDDVAPRLVKQLARPPATDRRPFTITCLRRDREHGFWTAHVTAGGTTFHVDRRYGSWQIQDGTVRREVLPAVARALQDRVRPLERAERS